MNRMRQQSRAGRKRQRGWARVEILLLLLVGLLGAWLVVALVGRRQQRRRCELLIVDLRAFATVLQRETEQSRRLRPRATEEALRETNWHKGSPFGGEYGWVSDQAERRRERGDAREPGTGGAITLTAFAPHFPLTLTRRDLRYIDARIDDGNLATGRFRTGFNGWPVYLIGDNR